MNQSYIRVLQAIELFCQEHLQIKKFASDFPSQLPNLATVDEAYPVLFVSPSETIFDVNATRYTIDVYCYDLIQKDRSNINTILSDTNLILNDLKKWMNDGDVFAMENEEIATAVPINNGLLDYAAGWVMTLSIDADTYTVCEIPFNNIPVVSGITNDVRYERFLTCESLIDCPVIQELLSGGTGGSGQVENFNWKFKSDLGEEDPGAGNFRVNGAILSNTDKLFFSDICDQSGFDISNLFNTITGYWDIYFQDTDDSTRFAQFTSTASTYLDNGGWWTVPVTFIEGSVKPSNNQRCSFLFINKNDAGVSTGTSITINGVTQDLSQNREWLTAQASTGILNYGTGITANTSTSIRISAMDGYIVDNESNSYIPTHTFISYTGSSNVPVTTIGSGIASYVLLDNTGTPYFQNTFPTSAERKSSIWIGKVAHPEGMITAVINEPDFITSPLGQFRDLFQALIYINKGVYPYPNGANLALNITFGTIIGDGINLHNSKTIPNEIQMGPEIATSFLYRTQTGGTSSATTGITGGFYDVSGATVAVPSTASTIQWIFCVPDTGFVIQFGQTLYPTLNDAVTAIGREQFVVFPSLIENAILIGLVALTSTATSLNDTAQAQFFRADKFGQIVSSQVGVSTSPATTLQASYDVSTQPQITTNLGLGAVQIKGTGTAPILQGLDVSNAIKFNLLANGSLTASTISATTYTNIPYWTGGVGTSSVIQRGSISTANGDFGVSEGFQSVANGDYSHCEGFSSTAQGEVSHAEGTDTLAWGYASHSEGQNSQANGNYSHAEGFQTQANNDASHSEGYFTQATGQYSHAEGWFTLASGFISHAEGYQTRATNNYTHAEGVQTYATGDLGCHAEGYATSATSQGSHSEGQQTLSSSNQAHAEGRFTLASGPRSHAEGDSTSATTDYAHSEGWFNLSSGLASHTEGAFNIASGQTAHAEGNQNIAGDWAHAEGQLTRATGTRSHSEGRSTQATGPDSHAEGSFTQATGTQSHAEGFGTLASGLRAHAEGFATIASGQYCHAEGQSTRATGDNSHAEGVSTLAQGISSHAEGTGTEARGDNSHSEGSGTTASTASSHAEGLNTRAANIAAHAEGRDTQALGLYSHAEGQNTIATGQNSHAEGGACIASGIDSHAEGSSTLASNLYAHAEGVNSQATAIASHAQGQDTFATAENAHAEGLRTIASGFTSHAEGIDTIAGGTYSHAEGDLSQAMGFGSHAEGIGAIASGLSSHAEGYFTQALGQYSHAQGQQTIANGLGSHAGGIFTTANGLGSFVHGTGSTAGGQNTIVLGGNIIGNTADTTYVDRLNIKTLTGGVAVASLGRDANGFIVIGTGASGFDIYVTGGTHNSSTGVSTFRNNSGGTFTVTGYSTGGTSSSTTLWSAGTGSNSIIQIGGSNIATGELSIAMGSGTSATTNYAHTEGFQTLASGAFGSHAEGINTQALGNFGSHAEGSSTTAAGQYSHAEGTNTQSDGNGSHAEGNNTLAAGEASHAEGIDTIANTAGSHAEGTGTLAQGGQGSHAEGYNTIAQATASHAEGFGTLAAGDSSHAEGSQTQANGSYSHAQGTSTIANGVASHAAGNSTTAGGDYSYVGGTAGSTANGLIGFAHGYNVHADNTCTVVLGCQNTTGTQEFTTYVGDFCLKRADLAIPTSAADATGEVGNITWDVTYLYVKTENGWGRLLLDYSW